MLIIGEGRLKQVIQDAVSDAESSVIKLSALRKEIATLEIERDKKREEWDRKEREIEHKIGLERKRQEFEIESAKRETGLKVREDNLAADKERFKSEMEFQRERLSGEVDSLRLLVNEMLKRLPSAEIYAEIGGAKK